MCAAILAAVGNAGAFGRRKLGGQKRRMYCRGILAVGRSRSGRALLALRATASITLPCFSMRDPYASLLLHGVKTVETRNHPMLQGVVGPCLLHIGHQTMDEKVAADFLRRTGIVDDNKLNTMMRPPKGMARGQILGVMELGETRLLTASECNLQSMREQVTSDAVGKYATVVSRVSWFQRPLQERGQPGVWQVKVPIDVLPPGMRPKGVSAASAPSAPQVYEDPKTLPRLVVFDLDGVCWSPEMYQTRGGPPYRLISEDVVVNSAGEEIQLYGAVRRVWAMLHDLRRRGHDIRVAVASSSQRHKAQPLLSTFEVAPGIRMSDVVDRNFFEMLYRKNEFKRPHLEAILRKSGVSADEVLFIDDNERNIESVSHLGIVAVHVPRGLSETTWAEVLKTYHTEHQIEG